MSSTNGVGVIELLSIEGEAKGSLDTRAKDLSVSWDQGDEFRNIGLLLPSKSRLTEIDDTSIVDLRLDECRTIKVRLCANLKVNTTMSRLAVVNCTSTSLHVTAHAMVVASTEGVEVMQTMKGNGVIRSAVAESCSVACDIAPAYVVSCFGTKQETVTAENSISSESRSLFTIKLKKYPKSGKRCMLP